MKKYLAVLLFCITTSASALELGLASNIDFIQKGTNPSGDKIQTGYAISVGQHLGQFSLEGSYTDLNTSGYRVAAIAGYDFAKIQGITLTAKLGRTFVNQDPDVIQTANGPVWPLNGWATLYGVSVNIPLVDHVSATVDYRYQQGQQAINNLDGSTVLIGVKYRF